MNKLLIFLLIIGHNTLAQNQKAEDIMNKIYENIINQNGTSLEFTYSFQNESYAIEEPIHGNITLFSNNRFYLEFNQPENKIIQIYNGEYLSTILLEEKEIEIDFLPNNSEILIQNIFKNHKSRFNSSIKYRNDTYDLIELLPKKNYNELVFNNCIDTLQLPSCLKLPKQCRIGIDSLSQMQLDQCLKHNKAYTQSSIEKIEIQINPINYQLISITQLNKYQGETKIEIQNTSVKGESILIIDTLLYKEYEIIDLR